MYQNVSGLTFNKTKDCMKKLIDVEGISVCQLEGKDIVRNDIIARILNKLNEK